MNSSSTRSASSRLPWILLGIVVVAAAVVLWLALGRDSGGDGNAAAASPSATATVPDAPPLDAARAAVLSAGLASGTEAGLRSVYDVSPQQPLDPAAVAAIAAMGTLTFDVGSFTDNKDGTATVVGTTTVARTEPAKAWTILLVAKEGQWLISQTTPQ